MVVTMKNGVFWDVTPCGSCKNRILLHIHIVNMQYIMMCSAECQTAGEVIPTKLAKAFLG
jgi:hypothetical protein